MTGLLDLPPAAPVAAAGSVAAAAVEAHHIRHWARGGATSLSNGVLLCGAHHRLIEQGDWAVRLAADGIPEFRPPLWIDPQRRPRRNHLHDRPD